MITEKQLANFKGMRTYGELKEIKGQLMNIYNQLYDMGIDLTESGDALSAVVNAENIVVRLMEKHSL